MNIPVDRRGRLPFPSAPSCRFYCSILVIFWRPSENLLIQCNTSAYLCCYSTPLTAQGGPLHQRKLDFIIGLFPEIRKGAWIKGISNVEDYHNIMKSRKINEWEPFLLCLDHLSRRRVMVLSSGSLDVYVLSVPLADWWNPHWGFEMALHWKTIC